MEYKFIIYASDNGVASVTLNRPEVYNALNDEITFELQDAFRQISADETIRVVVLSGSGKAFCSGQDLKGLGEHAGISFKEAIEKRYNPLIRLMRNLPKPVICKLNGIAAGAGCSLALACDLIVASAESSLVQAFVNIGLIPDSGSAYFLPRVVGMTKAFELAAMGTRLTANEALQIGMVNKVVPHDQLESATKVYVDYFRAAPTKAIGLIKKMLQKSGTSSLEEMLEYEAYCQEIAGHTADHTEGVKAFLEKRKPSFMGR